jgi:hypothetical protein
MQAIRLFESNVGSAAATTKAYGGHDGPPYNYWASNNEYEDDDEYDW